MTLHRTNPANRSYIYGSYKLQACIGTNSAVHLVILIKNEKCKMVRNCDSYVVSC